jgi:hypothetical protein
MFMKNSYTFKAQTIPSKLVAFMSKVKNWRSIPLEQKKNYCHFRKLESNSKLSFHMTIPHHKSQPKKQNNVQLHI